MRGEMSSPIIISSFVVFFSSFIGIFFENSWNLYIHTETVLVVVGSLISIFLGDLFARQYRRLFDYSCLNIKYKYVIKNNYVFLYIVFGVILLYEYYLNIEHFIFTMGLFDIKNTDVLLAVREARDNYEMPITLKVFTSFNNCLFITSCYCLIYNGIFFKLTKDDLKFLLPIIVYTATSVLNAARIDFLGPFFYVITLSLILLSYKYNYKIVIRKSIIKLFIASVAFLGLFALLRYFRGGEFNVFNHLAVYISGGLYCLDEYLMGRIYPFIHSTDFGSHTFLALYNLLDNFGIKTDISGSVTGTAYVQRAGFDCNIYTAFAPLVEDFGMSGCWFVMFIISMLMSLFYRFLLRKKKMGILLIMYAETMNIFFMLCIDQALFKAHFLPISRVVHFILVYMILRLMDHMREKNDKMD